MADINDRLERLSRRDELARRARERAVPPAAIAGVGADFIEVVEAVAQVVRRHPGMSVMIAPGDGRRRSAVIRVTERGGDAEIAPVTMGVTGDGHFGVPIEHQPPYAQAEPAPPIEQSYPDLVRPEFTMHPPEQGYADQPPPMPAQPAWRPPPPESVPQQPAPYEAAPADTWVWER